MKNEDKKMTQTEIDKVEIGPDIDFEAMAEREPENILPGELTMFKWSGVFAQRQKGFFTVRLVIPGGVIRSRQLLRAAGLSEKHARGTLSLTTRQTLQFHWVRLPDVHRIIAGMAEVGITTRNASGDAARNIVGCPLQGICPRECGDSRGLIRKLAANEELQKQQRNLPRKIKICVAGCESACAPLLINCIGICPNPAGGWKLFAGGGAGMKPYLAKPVFEKVPDGLITETVLATTEYFRRHGDRTNRAHARLKFVIDELGTEKFTDGLLELLKERGIGNTEMIIPAKSSAPALQPSILNGRPVIAQRQPGKNVVRLRLPGSEIAAEKVHEIAALADRFGDGSIILTDHQNIELRNVNSEQTENLLRELADSGFLTDGLDGIPDITACVGNTQCQRGIVDSPAAADRIRAEFASDPETVESAGPLRICISGCPNSCAQSWIADIGLRGKMVTDSDGIKKEGFSVFTGGGLDGPGHIAEHLCDVPAGKCGTLIRKLTEEYLSNRFNEKERFADYTRRKLSNQTTEEK